MSQEGQSISKEESGISTINLQLAASLLSQAEKLTSNGEARDVLRVNFVPVPYKYIQNYMVCSQQLQPKGLKEQILNSLLNSLGK